MIILNKFEEINKIFENISKHLSLGEISFPLEKKTEHIDYRDAYDNKSIDIVSNYYKDDLKFFDYKFD